MARRFVTYNTEDQKAGRVNVDHNGVMKPGGGGTGLPSDVGAYKYMATDSDGNWVPEDRLAWSETVIARVAIVADETAQSSRIEVNKNGVVEQVKQVDISTDVVNNSYLRVFNEPLTVEQMKSITVPSKGIKLADAWDELVAQGFVNDEYVEIPGMLVNVFEDQTVIEQGAFANKGLYMHLGIESDPSCLFEYIDSENVKKIDKKYLPIGFVRVTSGVDDSGSTFVKSDKTYQEISEMLAEGIIPKCIVNNSTILDLIQSSALSSVMPLAAMPSHDFAAVILSNGYYVRIEDGGYVSYTTIKYTTA